MKKNLFGAVAAGLALALAITSFGCESGSDDPVKLATDLGNPVTAGSKFTYVATPTSYTYKADPGTGVTVDESGSWKIVAAAGDGWTVTRYIDGVQSYNSTFANEKPYKSIDKSKPALGDVLKTMSQTVVLNSKDNTFTVSADSSSYDVKAIRLGAAATQGDTFSHVTLPFYFDPSASTNFEAAASAPFYTGSIVHTTAGDDGWATVKTVFDEALTNAKDDVQAKEAAVAAAATAAAKKTADANLKTAKEAQATLEGVIAAADLYKLGARYVITDTVTKSGATTGDASYYKDITKSLAKTDSNTNFIKKVSKAGGTAKPLASGVYKITSGNYSTGTFVVTTYTEGDNTYVFNEDGTYTLNGVLQINKADVDFTKADATHTGNKLYSGNRVFNITAGVLTAPRFESTRTDAALRNENNFFVGGSYTSYKDATTDASTNTSGSGTLNKESSYSYKLSR